MPRVYAFAILFALVACQGSRDKSPSSSEGSLTADQCASPDLRDGALARWREFEATQKPDGLRGIAPAACDTRWFAAPLGLVTTMEIREPVCGLLYTFATDAQLKDFARLHQAGKTPAGVQLCARSETQQETSRPLVAPVDGTAGKGDRK